MGDERVDEGAVDIAGAGMHDEAGGLVDDDDGIVLVSDIERDFLAHRFRAHRRRNADFEAVARFDRVFHVFYGRWPERDAALSDQGLEAGAAQGGQAIAQEAVEPLAGVAPVAIQEGRYIARVISARIKKKPVAPFHYRDRGSMAIIGRASAVAEIGRLHFSGYLAWLAWLFVHIVELVEFENKILVLVQWGWYYFSRNRAARLITRTAVPAEAEPERDKMTGSANVRC